MSLSHPSPSMPSPPPSRLRHRASFRERFWSRTSANYDGEDNLSTSISSSAPNPTSVYVPLHAASGFAKTVKSPRAAEFKRTPAGLATMREGVQENITYDEKGGRRRQRRRDDSDDEEEEGDGFAPPKSTPLARLLARPGHLYIHTTTCPPDQQQPQPTDDYDAFLSAARTNEYARRVLAASSTPHHQDQAPSNANPTPPPLDRSFISRSSSPTVEDHHSRASYASSSARLWNGGEHKAFPPATLPNPTTSTRLSASKSLRRQKSIRIIGQRIAEYVRPMRPDLASPTQQQYGR